MLLAVIAFVASGVVLWLAGSALARSADQIAEHTGLGRLWIGAVLLAGATSLPELATDISAVRLGDADLGAGDLFGSGMANMLVLAVADLFAGRRGLMQRVVSDHALTVSLAILLNALAAAFVLARPQYTIGWVGPESVILFVIYIVGMAALYRKGQREVATPTPATEPAPADTSIKPVLGRFAAAALVVLTVAPLFAWSASTIAEISGLGSTFVGTWLVGLSTSLPELVATIAAVRMGALDLAVGNLFGSNAFNMVVFLAMDLALPGANIFAALDPNHALSALFAVVLMSLGLAAIFYRSERRFALIEPNSLVMIAVYVVAVTLLYMQVPG